MKRFTIRFQNGSWCYVTPDAEGWAAVPRGCPALAEPWYTYCVWNNGGESIRPKQGYTWEYLDAVASGQPARDYSEWVEGKGDSARPPDYSPEKYESQVWYGERWESYSKCVAPLWCPEVRYRVRLRRPIQATFEPPTPTTDQEPPVLNSLIIRPDGCEMVVGGASVSIPHSSARVIAEQLCRGK